MNTNYSTGYLIKLFFLIFISVKMNAQSLQKIDGTWAYSDKYTSHYLEICGDSSFFLKYASCNGRYYISGTFNTKKDTLLLTGPIILDLMPPNRVQRIITKRFLISGTKILTFQEKNGKFDLFECLSKEM